MRTPRLLPALIGLATLFAACSPGAQTQPGAGGPDDALEAEAFANEPLGVKLSSARLERPELLTVRATVPRATTRVVFLRDGQPFAEDTAAPFEATLAFTKTERSSRGFSARAFAGSRSRTSAPVALTVAIGRVLYVSPTGSRTNDGLSLDKPLPTIQSAVNRAVAGDTVLVRDGTYRLDPQDGIPDDVVYAVSSGTPDAWIALLNYPGERPKVRLDALGAITVQAQSYWLIQGMTVEGKRDDIRLEDALAGKDNTVAGSGITITSDDSGGTLKHAHHVVVRGCTVYKVPGPGITTGQADYVTIEDNVAWGNAWYSPYDTSGIDVFQNWNSDDSTATKMIVRRNVVYDNRNLVPFIFSNPDPAKREITDGNGIIIDDARSAQTNPASGAYRGRTLVENNVAFENGGKGINVYSSDHVDVFNNTVFRNGFQPNNAAGAGDISIDGADIRVVNNVVVAREDRFGIKRIVVSEAERATQVVRRNIVFGGLPVTESAAENLIGVDPRLLDPANRDFRIAAGSPAVDAGDGGLGVSSDFLGAPRPLGRGVDIGAFEVR